MPADAESSALEWTGKRLTALSKALPSDFFSNDSKEMSRLNKGDYGFVPKTIRDAVVFDGPSLDSSRSISSAALKTSAWSALIMAAQTYQIAGKSKASSSNVGMVYVIGDRVYVPMEAVDGIPADLVMVLRRQSDSWAFDGSATGVLMSAKVRYTAVESLGKETTK